jgi:two-component system NarL family sensor kinase
VAPPNMGHIGSAAERFTIGVESAPIFGVLPLGVPGVDVALTFEAGQSVVADGHGHALGPGRLAPLYRPGGLRWVAAILAGAGAAAVALVLLSLSLSTHTRSEFMSARSVMLQGVVDEFVREGVLPVDPGDAIAMAALDDAVRLRLLGGEIVRVTLWAPDGRVLYSSGRGLAGERFSKTEALAGAFNGVAGYDRSSTDVSVSARQRRSEDLLKFFLPVRVGATQVPAAFEVYQSSTSFDASLDEVARDDRNFLLIGVGALLLVAAAAWRLHTRALSRRRADAERALGAAQALADADRRAMVATLHDDVGQPMFRLLYGIEGAAAQLPEGAVRDELTRLAGFVQEIDRELRQTLRGLHADVVEPTDFRQRLAEVAAEVQREAGLDIRVSGELSPDLDPTVSTALFRTAREAVHNVRKHAHARTVRIILEQDRFRARITVADDGHGWDGRMGLGLTTTSERLDAIGGRFQVRRSLGHGTRVIAEVPAARRTP